MCGATSVARVVIGLLTLAGPLPAAAQPQMADMVPLMTTEELVVVNALRVAASEEGVEVLTLPVGSWGTRLAARAEAAAELRRRTPGLSNGDILAELRRTRGDLFPGPGSDFDLTIALKDAPADGALAAEGRVVERARSFVRQERPDLSDLVKVMGERAWHEEKFSGVGGGTFALSSSPYALLVRPGTSPIQRIPAEAYYTERGVAVPKGLGGRPAQWLDDAMGIVASGGVSAGTGLTEDVARARAAVKYWKKFKGFFEGEFAASLPADLRASLAARLDEIPADVQDMLALDNEALVRRLESMRGYALETGPDGKARTVLDQFFERTFDSMSRYRDQVEAVDLVRRGRLAPTVEAVGEAVSRREAVQRLLLRTGGRALGAAAAHLLTVPAMRAALEKYATGDTLGFSRDVAGIFGDVIAPGAGLAAELADLGRELAAAGLIAAADAAFFDPLNQQALAAYYDTATEADGVFTMEGSPFAGLTRQSLYARYRMSPDDARRALARDAGVFVALLPKNERLVGHRATGFLDLVQRLGFLSAGPGSLTDALTAALVADWERSRQDADAVLAWGQQLTLGGYFVPALPPVSVLVDGEPVPADGTWQAAWTLAPGETRAVDVYLVRRFGKRYAIPGALRRFISDSAERRQSYFGTIGQGAGGVPARMMEVFESGFEVGGPSRPGAPPAAGPRRLYGRAAVERWVAASTGLYEVAPLDVTHDSARTCPGWTIDGPWSAGAGWERGVGLPYPGINGEGEVDTLTTRVRIAISAPAASAEPCPVDESFVVTWRAPMGGAEQRFAVYLHAALPVTTEALDFALTGRVTNRETGAPLPGARVVLSGARTYTTTAGADGGVEFAHVPAGTYEIAIGHAGFETRRASLTVTRDLLNGTFALTPLAPTAPAPPAAPAPPPTAPPAAAPGPSRDATFTASFGDNYVPKADKTDAGQPFTYHAPGPGTIRVRYTYRPAAPSTIRYYGDENGYRSQARLTWSGEGLAAGRLQAGMLYKGTTQLAETSATAAIDVTAAGAIVFKAYPEETPAYFYMKRWVDNWYDATHTHYHGGTATIQVTFTPR
ncbi:MAG: carboxypeptidase regulatory-like domain-containing protein [Vicinamibacterales bacterium]